MRSVEADALAVEAEALKLGAYDGPKPGDIDYTEVEEWYAPSFHRLPSPPTEPSIAPYRTFLRPPTEASTAFRQVLFGRRLVGGTALVRAAQAPLQLAPARARLGRARHRPRHDVRAPLLTSPAPPLPPPPERTPNRQPRPRAPCRADACARYVWGSHLEEQEGADWIALATEEAKPLVKVRAHLLPRSPNDLPLRSPTSVSHLDLDLPSVSHIHLPSISFKLPRPPSISSASPAQELEREEWSEVLTYRPTDDAADKARRAKQADLYWHRNFRRALSRACVFKGSHGALPGPADGRWTADGIEAAIEAATASLAQAKASLARVGAAFGGRFTSGKHEGDPSPLAPPLSRLQSPFA